MPQPYIWIYDIGWGACLLSSRSSGTFFPRKSLGCDWCSRSHFSNVSRSRTTRTLRDVTMKDANSTVKWVVYCRHKVDSNLCKTVQREIWLCKRVQEQGGDARFVFLCSMFDAERRRTGEAQTTDKFHGWKPYSQDGISRWKVYLQSFVLTRMLLCSNNLVVWQKQTRR